MRAVAWPFISMAVAALLLPTLAVAQTGSIVDGRVTEAVHRDASSDHVAGQPTTLYVTKQ